MSVVEREGERARTRPEQKKAAFSGQKMAKSNDLRIYRFTDLNEERKKNRYEKWFAAIIK